MFLYESLQEGFAIKTRLESLDYQTYTYFNSPDTARVLSRVAVPFYSPQQGTFRTSSPTLTIIHNFSFAIIVVK